VPTIRALSLCIAMYLTAVSSVGAQIQPRSTHPPEVAVSDKNRPIGLASIGSDLRLLRFTLNPSFSGKYLQACRQVAAMYDANVL
jgi:hypothetical protein